MAEGVDGLDTYHPGQKLTVLTPALRAKILAASKDAVHRVWKEAGLKPHRTERYMAPDDPHLGAKAEECRPQQEILIILDNLSAHKTKIVRELLAHHHHAQLHFAPTYSSRLNQVETWLGNCDGSLVANAQIEKQAKESLLRKRRRPCGSGVRIW